MSTIAVLFTILYLIVILEAKFNWLLCSDDFQNAKSFNNLTPQCFFKLWKNMSSVDKNLIKGQ